MIADPLQSDVAGGQVIRFRPRKGGSRVSRGGMNLIGNADQDHSPVPDLSRYQGKESSDEYRHRMMVNAVSSTILGSYGSRGPCSHCSAAAWIARSGLAAKTTCRAAVILACSGLLRIPR